ncbi:MAG TPA: branched-chain amino acid ABC transporter permease [Pyrinomonadaceae bacterium]|jgi:branched-chain amino acid transport system permease protein|nr:branched-chain amino acid ABC transporter permease [Pyrinomonadaceae bacterium]
MPGFAKKLAGAVAILVALFAVNAMMSRAGLFGFGLGAYETEVLMLVGINVILAVSLNLINGFTGQFSIGHAGFMAIGAYSSAYFTVYHGQNLEQALGGGTLGHVVVFSIAILIGAIVAGLMGLLVGVPSLRLRGDYLAIVTLGFAEIIRIVILNLDVVGGATGFSVPGSVNFLWVGICAVITIIVVRNIVKSDTGRALISIREDELAAEAMGVNTTRYKVLSFVIGSAFAGVAGALFGHFKRFLATPDFTFIKSFEVIIMIVLGGMGSITGAVLGAIVITILPELLRQLPSIGGFNFADLRLVIYAALLIVIMLTRPQGMLGEREIGLHWLRRAQKAPEGDRQVGDDKGVPIAQGAARDEEVEKR